MNGSSWLHLRFNAWSEEHYGNFPEVEYKNKGNLISHVYSGKKTKAHDSECGEWFPDISLLK